jgi:Tfp pilus assembly protein FimT
MKNKLNSRGFTVVELLLIMGITSILLGTITINLLKVQHNTSVSTAIDTLLVDMKGQQVKAMNGALVSSNGDSYGIYFDPIDHSKYILFHGTAYLSSDSTNFSVVLDKSIAAASTFTGNILVFSEQSGEVANFSSSKNTITLTNTAGPEQAVITVNRYGVVTNIQ